MSFHTNYPLTHAVHHKLLFVLGTRSFIKAKGLIAHGISQYRSYGLNTRIFQKVFCAIRINQSTVHISPNACTIRTSSNLERSESACSCRYAGRNFKSATGHRKRNHQQSSPTEHCRGIRHERTSETRSGGWNYGLHDGVRPLYRPELCATRHWLKKCRKLGSYSQAGFTKDGSKFVRYIT